MINARMLGFNVQKAMRKENKSVTEMSKILNCSEHDFNRFLSGRLYLSLKQYHAVADALDVPMLELLEFDEEYNKSYVHCYGEFTDVKNREKILDIIDNYIDIIELIELAERGKL